MADPRGETVVGAGQTLFKEGEKGGSLYFIKKGKVELSIKDRATGEPVVVSVIGPQSVIGTMSFLEGEPRSATAKALTEISFVKVTEIQREKLLGTIPNWFKVLVKDLSQNIRKLNERYSELQTTNALLEKKVRVLKQRLGDDEQDEESKSEADPSEESTPEDSTPDKESA